MSRYPSLFDGSFARRADNELSRIDPQMRRVRDACGDTRLPPRRKGGAFGFLVRTVVFQQLATSAAASIHRRLIETHGAGGRVTPDGLLAAGPRGLRAVGLSAGKSRSILELSDETARGAFAPQALSRHPDATVRNRVTALRGFGPWSADVFLLFHLGRPDVFPESDLGLRHAARDVYGGDTLWAPRDLAAKAEQWRPYRSLAALWLWRHRSGTKPDLD